MNKRNPVGLVSVGPGLTLGAVVGKHISGDPGGRVLRVTETHNFSGGTRQRGAERGKADVGQNRLTMLQGSRGLPV